MKKIFAAVMAVLTAAVVAGCGSTADEQLIDDIPEDTSIAAEVEASESEGTSETADETETESVSEAETTVGETVPEMSDNEDSNFPVGSWIGVSGTEKRFYVFDEDSQFDIGLETHDIFGKYTFEDDLLTLIFDIEFHNGSTSHAEYAFDVRKGGSVYRLRYNYYESVDITDLPYPDAGDEDTSYQGLISCLSTLFADFESETPIFLIDPKDDNKPVLAQQEDMIGAWLGYVTDLEDNFLSDCIIIVTDSTVKLLYVHEYYDMEITIKDGRPVLHNDPDPNVTYSAGYLKISGDMMYFATEDTELAAGCRYEHESVTPDYFDGEYISVFCDGEDMGSVVIENGTGISEEYGLEIRLSLNGDKVRLALNGEEDEYSYYIIETVNLERYIYFVNDNNAIILLKDIDEE